MVKERVEQLRVAIRVDHHVHKTLKRGNDALQVSKKLFILQVMVPVERDRDSRRSRPHHHVTAAHGANGPRLQPESAHEEHLETGNYAPPHCEHVGMGPPPGERVGAGRRGIHLFFGGHLPLERCGGRGLIDAP